MRDSGATNEAGGAEERLERLRQRLAAACARAGRRAEDVRVAAVSKTFGPQEVTALAQAGQTVFAESRVQEAKQKIPLCPGGLEWHMIGHLQKNKIKDVLPWCAMLHSADSAALLESLNAACERAGRTLPVLLEVNLAGEASKFGFAREEVPAVLERCAGWTYLDVNGLMTLPPASRDSEDARPYFRLLRELRDGWRAESGFDLAELSMGMSGDFEVAVEEGATWIRPGTCLFRERT
jgi:PLP dependent protein